MLLNFRNGNERWQVQEGGTESHCPPGECVSRGELTVYTVPWSSEEREEKEREEREEERGGEKQRNLHSKR